MKKRRKRMRQIRLCAINVSLILISVCVLLHLAVQQCTAASSNCGQIVTDLSGQVSEGLAAGQGTRDEISVETGSYAQSANAAMMAPRKLELWEAVEELEEKSGDYPELLEITANVEQYPEDMLVALCNNPEMYEFVKNYTAKRDYAAVELTKEEREDQWPLLLQWDMRWGYVPYGSSIIGLSGCGPACLSMVVIALTGDESITPDVIASYSMDMGYYVEGVGTSWNLMKEGAHRFGLTAEEISPDEQMMKDCLDSGCPLICSMGPGDFTAAGHFVVICGYDEKGFKINDPNCIVRSMKSWSYDEIEGQIRVIWAYSI